jgi:predicted nucleic-acid-binding protein
MLEVEWVLRTKYHYDRQMVTAALNALLDVTELEFQVEPALEQALWLFKQSGSRDFADCLHIALVSQTGKGPLLTFDDRASKMEGARLLRG